MTKVNRSSAPTWFSCTVNCETCRVFSKCLEQRYPMYHLRLIKGGETQAISLHEARQGNRGEQVWQGGEAGGVGHNLAIRQHPSAIPQQHRFAHGMHSTPVHSLRKDLVVELTRDCRCRIGLRQMCHLSSGEWCFLLWMQPLQPAATSCAMQFYSHSALCACSAAVAGVYPHCVFSCHHVWLFLCWFICLIRLLLCRCICRSCWT